MEFTPEHGICEFVVVDSLAKGWFSDTHSQRSSPAYFDGAQLSLMVLDRGLVIVFLPGGCIRAADQAKLAARSVPQLLQPFHELLGLEGLRLLASMVDLVQFTMLATAS